MKYQIFIALLFFLVTSCQNKKEKLREQRREIKKELLNRLISKYDIKYNIDEFKDSNLIYSIDFKPIIESNYQIISDFHLNDIFEKNSIKYISISAGYYSDFYFDFEVTDLQISKFRKHDNYKNKSILVVDITSIKKVKLSINSDIEGEKEDEYVITYFEDSSDFIGFGKVIEIISY